LSEALISIIIPVFNGEKFLSNCFKIINEQDYHNLEIIFVDNNSKDNSFNVLKKYCSSRANSFVYKCSKQSPAAARNIGIKYSNGIYLSFLDVDDSITPSKYTKLYSVAKKYPDYKVFFGIGRKKMINGNFKTINYGDIVSGLNKAPSSGLLWLNQFQHQVHPCAILVHHSVVDKVKGFPEKLFYGEDIAFMVKIGLCYDTFFIEELVYTKNENNSSITFESDKYISPNERFLHFYKYFGIKYFFERKKDKLYKLCFEIVEFNSFKNLIRLIKYDKKYKYISDLKWQYKFSKSTFLSELRLMIFMYLPMRIANFIYVNLTRLSFLFSKRCS